MMPAISHRKTILLTMALFGLQPLAHGAWLALIPFVKDSIGLNKAELAIALLGMPIALIPSLQIASRMISRFGPRRLLAVAFPFQVVAVTLPFLADSLFALFFILMLYGVVMAFMQVCLNVYAGRLEKQMDVMVMSRCHGFWALGLTAGSFAVAGLASISPLFAVLAVGVPSAAVGIWTALTLPHLGSPAGQAAPPRRAIRQMPAALLYISLFVLVVSMAEGAMQDWAAIYLAERLPDGATTAGIAVSLYAGFLAAGRFLGDSLKRRLGAVGLARLTVMFAITGLLLLVLPLPLYLAYPGFALIGLGASVGFPLGVSAVAALDDTYEGANIAIMSMVALSGFLIGPPMIGFLAESFTLRVGLAALMPGLLISLWLARWLKPRESAPEG